MERWLSWSKAHDWKSCKDLNSFEGSNPSLSAKQKEHTIWCALFVYLKGIRTSRPNKQSGGLFVGEGFSAEKRIPLFLFCCNERRGRNRIRTLESGRIPTKSAQVCRRLTLLCFAEYGAKPEFCFDRLTNLYSHAIIFRNFWRDVRAV